MEDRKISRKKAIIRRRIFISLCACVLALVIALLSFIAVSIFGGEAEEKKGNENDISSEEIKEPEKEEPKPEEFVTLGGVSLSADFSNLLLVNGENPLPEDYDYEGNLTEIPKEYIKGSLTQINKDVWPYLKAMLDDARAEGVDIGVWSPYRSYNTQKKLFNNQVERQKNNSASVEEAEAKAATIVARPGTSEHHTGLALDINCANDSFEKTAAFAWLNENAEKYGFIMRYSAEKQSITGVIHESWHWRFVGIKSAKEIKEKGICLEEYIEDLENTGRFEGN